jgi:transcriptional regulator with XRE-family HTH domain
MRDIAANRDLTPPQKLGMSIRLARVALEWSQTDLGDRLHVSRDVISRFERGESVPDHLMMLAIARALGQSMDYFQV